MSFEKIIEKEFKSYLNFIKKHPITTIIAVLLIAIFFANPIQNIKSGLSFPGLERAIPGAISNINTENLDYSKNIQELSLKKADIYLKTNNIEKEIDEIKNQLEKYDGYIEEQRKYESNNYVRYILKLRIPSDKFEDFTEEICKNAKTCNIYNYKIDITYSLDQKKILLEEYKKLEELANKIRLNNSKDIETLNKIYQQMLYIEQRLSSIEHDLAIKYRDYNYSIVNLNIEEEKPVEISKYFDGREIWNEIKIHFATKTKELLIKLPNTIVDIIVGTIIFTLDALVYLIKAIITLFAIKILWNFVKQIF